VRDIFVEVGKNLQSVKIYHEEREMGKPARRRKKKPRATVTDTRARGCMVMQTPLHYGDTACYNHIGRHKATQAQR